MELAIEPVKGKVLIIWRLPLFFMGIVVLIIPIYARLGDGRLDFASQTLESIVRQKTGLRILPIVVDDGSEENVDDFLNEFMKSHKGFEVRYLKRERASFDLKSSSAPINFGFNHLLDKGYYMLGRGQNDGVVAVGYLHSDDGLTTTSVQERFDLLAKTGGGFVYTPMAYFRSSEIIGIRRGNFGTEPHSILYNLARCSRQFNTDMIWFNNHTVLLELGFLGKVREYSKRMLGQNGCFDENMTYVEDLDFSTRAVKTAMEQRALIGYLDRTSVLYRVHGTSITGEGNFEEKIYYRKIYHQNHFAQEDYPFSISQNNFPHTSKWSASEHRRLSIELNMHFNHKIY